MIQSEIVATVNAHLKLVELSSGYQSDEATLRAISASLRSLLAEGGLAKAWRASALGGPMTFNTWCITSVGAGDVVALCGGGDMLPNLPFSAARNATLGKKTLDLKAFCGATRIQVNETKISTVELVRFISNALGGTHFDDLGKASRKSKGQIIAKLIAGEIQAVPLKVNERNLVHHEILSIAQTVIRSPEVSKLRLWTPS